jgi:hypothetical protein
MEQTQILKGYINFLRNFLIKNSINETYSKHIELLLSNEFTFITNLTFKREILFFQRVTVNSNVNDGNEIRINDISKLKYPPNGARENGRANLIGEKILYATDNIITALKEVRVKENELITISTWKLKTNYKLTFTPIFKFFPKKSEVINIDLFNLQQDYKNKLKEYDKETQEQINIFVQFLADCFTKDVDNSNHYDYFLSSFYAHKLLNFLQHGEIDAILYPSVQDDLITTNIAMKHTIFDDNYELIKAEEKKVSILPNGKHSYCELIPIAESVSFSKNQINW